MKLAILANDIQQQEWLSKPQQEGAELIWVSNHLELQNTKADAYFDLMFEPGSNRLESFPNYKPVFINEVVRPLSLLIPPSLTHLNFPVFRLNAWPTFLKRDVLEIACEKKEHIGKAGDIFSPLGWKFKSVPDIPGFISARVIAMIINEAYFTLQDEVSTKEEIDIAMKLGTNYPYGPFEWSKLIGLPNIYRLLTAMSKADPKYRPSDLLKMETEQHPAWH
jgi:3-hydroxybutyryl-CoA dehydrogenase